MSNQNYIIKIENLTLSYKKNKIIFKIFNDFSFELLRGEKTVLLGESGSGKSTLAKLITGLLAPSAKIEHGKLYVDNFNIPLNKKFIHWNKIRGKKIAMIYQDAREALNPTMTIYTHFLDLLLYHKIAPKKDVYSIAKTILTKLLFDDPDAVLKSYSFELSGGMCQRVCIALCVSIGSDCIIADEPTSALDVISQYEVLNTLKALKNQTVLMITHDIAAASMIADRILMLKDGVICENSCTKNLIKNPKSEYAKSFIAAYTALDNLKYNHIAKQDNILQVKNLTKKYDDKKIVIDNLSFNLKKEEILSILGSSGCGKSTLARCIMGLENSDYGEVLYANKNLLELKWSERRKLSARIQIIFQDARACLNPYYSIFDIVQEPLIYNKLYDKNTSKELAEHMLLMVGLKSSLFRSKPMQLSSGQCQRVGIARALITKPDILICDEPVSSLDVNMRLQILELIIKLKKEFNLSIIMISHDFKILKSISNRIAVMNNGTFIDIYDNVQQLMETKNIYTQKLINLSNINLNESAFPII